VLTTLCTQTRAAENELTIVGRRNSHTYTLRSARARKPRYAFSGSSVIGPGPFVTSLTRRKSGAPSDSLVPQPDSVVP